MAILKPDKTIALDTGLTVNEYLLTNHNPYKIDLPAKRTLPLIGVSVHNTEWIDVAAGTTPAEQYTRATQSGNMKTTRVHYYVDDKCAWRNFDDSYITWHSATGNGQGNGNTVSVECIMRNATDAQSLASMDNCARLVAAKLNEYGWTVEKNLYTHNYWTNYKVTGQCSADLDAQNLKKVPATAKCLNSSELANPYGKYCPAFILPQWEKFKALVKKYMAAAPAAPVAPSVLLEFKAGDVVMFSGGAIYGSSDADLPARSRGKSKCKVTQVSIYKHHYHLVSEDGEGVCGWVDKVDVSAITDATIIAGSKVKIKSGATYYNGGAVPTWVIAETWIVSEVKGDCALIRKSVNGKYDINSPVNVGNLTLV